MRCDNQEEQIFTNGYKVHAGNFLEQAVNWFKDNEITLWGEQIMRQCRQVIDYFEKNKKLID